MTVKHDDSNDSCKAFMPDTVSRCKQCSSIFIEKKLSCKCGKNDRRIDSKSMGAIKP